MYITGCISLGVCATLWIWVCLNGLVFGYNVTMCVIFCYSMCEGVGINNDQSYYMCGFLNRTMTADVTLPITIAQNSVK